MSKNHNTEARLTRRKSALERRMEDLRRCTDDEHAKKIKAEIDNLEKHIAGEGLKKKSSIVKAYSPTTTEQDNKKK